MATFPKRASYGIFVRFRRSRLALRRGIQRLEDALAIAEQIRATRFHDRGDIFVMKEPEGTVFELSAASAGSQRVDPGHDGEDPPPPPTGTAPPAPVPAPAPAPAPVPVPVPASAPSAAPREAERPPRSPAPARPSAGEVEALLARLARAERLRETLSRAHAALARLERAFTATERTMARQGEEAPADVLRSHARLGAVRAEAARSIASFEGVAALVVSRLDLAWTDPDARADSD